MNWKDANASEEVLALLEVIEGHGESILTETDALWTRSQYLKEADEYLRTNFGGSDNPKKYPDLKILHQVVRIDNQTKTTTSLGPPSESELTKTSEISEQDKATEELKNKCKMFPKVPKGLVTLQTGKVELMRLSAAYELFQTEVDYNQDLSIMLHVRLLSFHMKQK